MDTTIRTEPATGLEGKFSLRVTTAMALLGDDTTDPASFNDARVDDTASAPASGPTNTRNKFESFGPAPAVALKPFFRNTEISKSDSDFGTAANCK